MFLFVEEISARSKYLFFFQIIDMPSSPYVTWILPFLRFRNLNLTSKSTLVLKRILTRILTI
ncbi:hypothetical protein CHU32_01635 [Superficieibacter electus]|uniref:Uncharacterized protein n=1 Tax=Superficieibacter electus TaxID=2022662 RepID=A0A2P5GWR6_9ENTR|nr:hypothetical protein CHU33_01630 [Superficieibacter electus]POP50975.1 hypothetical protein CHU32_01635 [Superficieibacter electus]